MGSQSVTYHLTQMNVPAGEAGIRFTYPGGMEVDLGSLIATQPGIEPTTAWSQVWRPNCYATNPSTKDCNLPYLTFKADSC